jgi:ubiquinone/menaquinone biosynthesis C-methylase UbiE
MTQQIYDRTSAAGYEQAFAHVSSHFVPLLLRAAALSESQRVLDVATGSGLAAEAALDVVGPRGHVTAADISADMVAKARERLSGRPNVTLEVADGQALGFAEASFDAVLCSLGLMFFPDPARGLSEFHRVLRPGGRAAVSVNTVPEKSYNTRIHVIMARHVPSLAASAQRLFALSEPILRDLYAQAGFRSVQISTASEHFTLPSFAHYFEHVERGWGSPGQVFVSLPAELRDAVREEVRRDVGDRGGPVTLEVEYRFASGIK